MAKSKNIDGGSASGSESVPPTVKLGKNGKPKPPYNLRMMITNQLRKLFLFHPCQRVVRQRNRVEQPKFRKDGSQCAKPAVFYRCQTCTGLFKSTEVQVDHISPVVPIEGFEGWSQYVSRMFCESDAANGYVNTMQLSCKACHTVKTSRERDLRTAHRRANKLEGAA